MGRIGYCLLAFWLIIIGAIQALSLSFAYQGVILGCLLIGVGICILIGK